jgi:hypothetical protein
VVGVRTALAVDAVWRTAVAEAAASYRVECAVLGQVRPAPAQRGARLVTPPLYVEPRKVAVYVAVLVADCSCVALARAIGMHRDTVHSQCRDVRQGILDDGLFARRVAIIEQRARVRLASLMQATIAACAQALELLDEESPLVYAAELSADEDANAAGGHPTFFRKALPVHENVIEFRLRAAE